MPGLVLDPDFTFNALDARLEALGWQSVRVGSGLASLIPGEPELATWRRGRVRLIYTFNPAVRLRMLDVRGGRARGLAKALPLLDATRVQALLASADRAEVLLGLLAARVVKGAGLREGIRAWSEAEDPLLSKVAAQTLAGL
ncbi:MAG: hypothetical protein H6739_30055 [Alphaproteobacteria bacterium]|nr:hypothetical protein [Alphaproteobacteria bacterium]